ncbi:MAG TPA: bifunctional protein-serine/threonine kinase/phosphatase [Marinobacter sp.]|uniref:bifunctional protein-serine/threonine kinase/phosphatase n=1 Tax=Marinobacter sp. TaxID=50741 RepID=UPI002D7FA7AC|nr:bifunctional protein-serine/threonine kinase/phosphatase [Marinobacter sp.]HET8799925.1 bifunctional protein-serine/threonine kinase/phosphatase [Marinobacter sp.]
MSDLAQGKTVPVSGGARDGSAPATRQLRVSTGQYSDRGRKPLNQDFHGLLVPDNHQLATKGIAIAIADGISSSNVSQIASESSVAGFLSDYYSTPDSWSVKQSAQRVLHATNAWLYAQTRQSQYRYDRDRGYVCTLSVLILKSSTGHLFHIGDTRICRVHGRSLEQLTTDHRLWLSPEESCLTRAMGIGHQLDIDYQSLALTTGDLFLLATDGVYEYLDDRTLAVLVRDHADDLDSAARAIVDMALANGSNDNLTVQLVRIESVPDTREAGELYRELGQLPFAPELMVGQTLDGYRILRPLHASSRSHVYHAIDEASGTAVVIKTPSMEQRDDPVYIERFLAEEWIAQRIRSPHVARPFAPERRRSCIYLVTAFIDGGTLRQWIDDHPNPDLETVRGLVEQIGKGLRAFHRLEMVHQDLKPENVLIDRHGTATLIDFGATRVAGLQEISHDSEGHYPRGAALYSAPETFLGEPGSWLADQFSLAVITYQMLTGRLPYGAEVPKIRSASQQRRLNYQPARLFRDDVPAWVDDAIARAAHPEPHKRYPALSEFLFDLRHPNRHGRNRHRPPLIERHPVAFWQGVSALLLLALLVSRALP